MFDHTRKINVVVALAAMVVINVLAAGFADVAEPEEMQIGGPSANTIVTAQPGNDPGIAFMSGSQTSQYSRVGRITVQLIRNGTTQEVPFDWAFHTNEEFRFRIATNKEGWLYILHRSPGGQMQLLYPPIDPGTGQPRGNSRVAKNDYYLVPQPTEGSFIFDADAGAETFFMVIKDRPDPPSLNDIQVSGSESLPQPQGAGGQQYPQQYQSPPTVPASQYPPQLQNAGGQQYPPQYQAAATVPVDQYPYQSQSAGAQQYPQQYQSPPTVPASQYPPQPQGAGGQQYPQQYQSPVAVPSSQYPPQPQSAGGQQYQQQYQAPAAIPASPPPQPGTSPSQSRQQWQQLALDTLNYSVIPKAVIQLEGKKIAGLKYRGVRFKPQSSGNDPGTYFAPQPDSDLQDAWFVFKLNHIN